MVLSDRTIREEIAKGRIVIEPYEKDYVQPASVDLRLDKKILEFSFETHEEYSYIDVSNDVGELTTPKEIPEPLPYVLKPGQFILATTLETVQLPDDVVGRLEGKSSLGRLGLLVHATAGYVDPGFRGQLTLEISNVANAKIALYSGMKISQLSFLRMSTPVERPYGSPSLGSKYQGQMGPTASRMHLNYKSSTRSRRNYDKSEKDLAIWLEESEFEGSIQEFASVLQVKYKTVEDWVYGRHQPNRANKRKLYEVTGLEKYALERGAREPALSDELAPGLTGDSEEEG